MADDLNDDESGSSESASSSKVSFFEKKDSLCPICEHPFRIEKFMTGGGRMNAGQLHSDLRREWLPSKKYGEIYPLIYDVVTCPACWYSAIAADFLKPDPKAIPKLKDSTDDRKAFVADIFPELNFTLPKGLREGVAGYLLALHGYQFWGPNFAPSLKSALCSIRASWIFQDLYKKFPQENFDYLSLIMKHKARFFYSRLVDRETTGKESVGSVTFFGPDIDYNWGYDGVLYLVGYLEFNLGDSHNETDRQKKIERARMILARLVGLGKSSKSKPSAMLDMAKELYHKMGDELKGSS